MIEVVTGGSDKERIESNKRADPSNASLPSTDARMSGVVDRPHHLTDSEVQKIIEQSGIYGDLNGVVRDEVGRMNRVHFVTMSTGERLVFRVSYDLGGYGGLSSFYKEMWCYDQVRKQGAGVPVQKVKPFLLDEVFPHRAKQAISIISCLPGINAAEYYDKLQKTGASPKKILDLWEGVGDLNRRINQVTVDSVSTDFRLRSDGGGFVPKLWESTIAGAIESLHKAFYRFSYMAELSDRQARKLQANIEEYAKESFSTPYYLAHRDLGLPNVVVDPERGVITGGIDFAVAQGGITPHLDLGLRVTAVADNCGTNEEEAYLSGYGFSLNAEDKTRINLMEIVYRMEYIEHFLSIAAYTSFVKKLGRVAKAAIGEA